MNDTIISPRQRAILDVLSQNPILRSLIEEKIQERYPISKLTLIRELNVLISLGLAKAQGVGKSTAYISLENPLEKFIDRRRYFTDASLRVNVKIGFDFGILEYNAI